MNYKVTFIDTKKKIGMILISLIIIQFLTGGVNVLNGKLKLILEIIKNV